MDSPGGLSARELPDTAAVRHVQAESAQMPSLQLFVAQQLGVVDTHIAGENTGNHPVACLFNAWVLE